MRETWLDNAKMFAMICVIVGHIGDLFGGWPFDIGALIVGFNMPIFFLLAGMTSFAGLCKIDSCNSLVEYGEKTLYRMVIPAVCFSAIDQAWIGLLFARKLWCLFGCGVVLLNFVNTNGDSFLRRHFSIPLELIKGPLIVFLLVSSFWLNMYWFVSSLLKLQLLISVLVLLSKEYSTRYRFLCITCLAYIFSFYFYNSWTFDMSIYFLLGGACKYINVLEKLWRLPLWLSLFCLLIGFFLCKMFTINYGFYHFSLNRLIEYGVPYIYVLKIVVALLISFPILIIIKCLSNEYGFFSKMGSKTLAFYTIHCLLLDDFIKPYIRLDHGILSWMLGLLFVPLFVCIVYEMILLFERYKFTRRYLLGILK